MAANNSSFFTQAFVTVLKILRQHSKIMRTGITKLNNKGFTVENAIRYKLQPCNSIKNFKSPVWLRAG